MGALAWWIFGNGLAFGEDSGGFIGTTGFALRGEKLYGTDTGDFNAEGYALWLFQWAFAATATTIVSGAMAERATFGAYVLHSSLITTFICEWREAGRCHCFDPHYVPEEEQAPRYCWIIRNRDRNDLRVTSPL